MIEGVSSQSEPPTSPVLLPLWRPPGICREASKVKIGDFYGIVSLTFSGVIYFFLGALVLFKLELVVHLPPQLPLNQ